jgi:hypothetical protein
MTGTEVTKKEQVLTKEELELITSFRACSESQKKRLFRFVAAAAYAWEMARAHKQ